MRPSGCWRASDTSVNARDNASSARSPRSASARSNATSSCCPSVLLVADNTGLLDQLHACMPSAARLRRTSAGCASAATAAARAYFGGRASGLFGRCQGQQGEAALQGRHPVRRGRALVQLLAAALAGQAVGVDFPAVVAQHLPVFCGQSVRRGQCRCQGGGDGAAAPAATVSARVNSAASLPPATRVSSLRCGSSTIRVG